ncbi:Proton glutamate symport protein [Roseimaritima multifibrata]|uniref:Proton glutamate symport protein n=1 Tax=Roseimaritima multifibrata TaxID=1930274 RepID=A0A517MDU6_9BACT|nr:dicarboxylate/amino acid:cation symporter [Roseimaritima multifibrata]QDS93061.1 Proton glutamate symport protein [Roseimaritima multifibrata]
MPDHNNDSPEGKPGGHDNRLTYWIGGGIIAAIVLALVAPHIAVHTKLGGELFLRSLRMIVVPLVFTSVMCGVLGMGDIRRLGKPGLTAVVYYLLTTILAVTLGLIVVNVLKPGVGTVAASVVAEHTSENVGSPKGKIISSLASSSGLSKGEVAEVLADLPEGESSSPSVTAIVENMALMLVTDNLVVAAAETELLPIIMFAIIFAGMLTTMGNRVSTLTACIVQINDALLQFVMLLMKIAPLGIFCLVAARFGEAQLAGQFAQEIKQIGWYFGAVIAGLAIHAGLVLPLIYWIVTRKNPYRYMLDLSQALLTAFSTASSSATLPVTMKSVEDAGVSRRSSEFVIPLGATINMDGTALYEAAAVLFIAQVLGLDMTLTQQIIIALTATLAAIGAAGIPEAGLVTMLIVLNAVNLPIEYIGLILSVDWLLDRFRTAVNCWGDAVGAAVVDCTIPNEVPPTATDG